MSLFEDKELFTELLKDGQEGDHIGNVKAMVTELVQSADIYFNRSKYDYYARLNVSDETKSARELLAISIQWLSSKSISKDALDALGDAAVSLGKLVEKYREAEKIALGESTVENSFIADFKNGKRVSQLGYYNHDDLLASKPSNNLIYKELVIERTALATVVKFIEPAINTIKSRRGLGDGAIKSITPNTHRQFQKI